MGLPRPTTSENLLHGVTQLVDALDSSLSGIVKRPVVDADVSASAGITYPKLSLAASVKNSDLIGGGGVLADMPPGRELTYNEFTSAVTVTATSEGTADTVVTASAYSFDGATPVLVEFFSPHVGSPGALFFWLYDGSGSIGELGRCDTNVPVLLRRLYTPSSASHTFSIRASLVSGTGSVGGGSGGPSLMLPGYIRITKA